MKRTACVTAITILPGALPSVAAIVLCQVGDDLRIGIENDITFRITHSVTDANGIGIYLDDIIITVGDGGFFLNGGGSAPSIVSPALTANPTPWTAVARRIDGLELFFFSRSSMSLAVDDAVTITAGELTIPDFFSSPIIGGLSRTIVEEAIFADSRGFLLSDPTSTAIPETSVVFTSACGFLLCLTRRLRNWRVESGSRD